MKVKIIVTYVIYDDTIKNLKPQRQQSAQQNPDK